MRNRLKISSTSVTNKLCNCLSFPCYPGRHRVIRHQSYSTANPYASICIIRCTQRRNNAIRYHMVSAIRQTPSGRYATVMLPQAWILFSSPYLSIVCFVIFSFPFFSFSFFWPFCGTSVINSIGRNAPAPILKARAQETGPVQPGGHTVVILLEFFFSFYSSFSTRSALALRKFPSADGRQTAEPGSACPGWVGLSWVRDPGR